MKSPSGRDRDPRFNPSAKRPKPKPQPDPFQFDGIDDFPKGVKLRKASDRTVAKIPNTSLFAGIFLFLASAGALALNARTFLNHNADKPLSFLIFMSVVGFGLLAFSMFHFFGYSKLEIRNGHLYISRGFWGMSMARSMPLSSIKMIGTKRKRMAMRAFMGPAGMMEISDGQAGNVYLFIDGEQEVEALKGAHGKYVYYAKYFLAHFIREDRELRQQRAMADGRL